MADKSYTDDQLPLAAIDPPLFGGVKLTHAQAALLSAYKKLPDVARAMLKRQAVAARMDYIEGRDIRQAAMDFGGRSENPQDVLRNAMADSMAEEPDVLASTVDDEDPFASTITVETFGVRRRA